jgi:hypothetical protein
MGILMSKLFESLFGSKEVRILILGLDNAGEFGIIATLIDGVYECLDWMYFAAARRKCPIFCLT